MDVYIHMRDMERIGIYEIAQELQFPGLSKTRSIIIRNLHAVSQQRRLHISHVHIFETFVIDVSWCKCRDL